MTNYQSSRDITPSVIQTVRIQGTVSGSNVKRALMTTRSMFISPVDRETSDDDMRDWISKQKIIIINFEYISHDDAKYKFYKLIVSVSDYVSCKPSQWPMGIYISKYHPPKATKVQNNGINLKINCVFIQYTWFKFK